MDKQNLIIFKFKSLFKILNELVDNSNFNISEVSSKELLDKKLNESPNCLVISQSKIDNLNNLLILNNLPIKFMKLLEKINIEFIKLQFNKKSDLKIGNYQINLNSREILSKNVKLSLTEKEIDIIIYLSKSNIEVSIEKLQFEVWGHNSKLETHTVETHIYRLRKKILKTFNDDNFIMSQPNGYAINLKN